MIQFEQVRLLYDQATTGFLVTFLAMLVLGTFLLTEGAPVPTIGTWWLVTILILAGRWRLVQKFRQSKDRNSNPIFWCRRFVVGATLAG